MRRSAKIPAVKEFVLCNLMMRKRGRLDGHQFTQAVRRNLAQHESFEFAFKYIQ